MDDDVQVQVISIQETVNEWVEREEPVTMRWCWWVLAVTPWQNSTQSMFLKYEIYSQTLRNELTIVFLKVAVHLFLTTELYILAGHASFGP